MPEHLNAEITDAAEVMAQRRRRNMLSCDLLLARMFRHHPDHALVALEGIRPAKVIDLEPPERPPDVQSVKAKVVPLYAPAVEITVSDAVRPTLKIINTKVAWFYDVDPLDFFSMRRDANYVRARQIAAYLACKLTKKSLPDIGRSMDRDHSTILHSRRKIEKELKTNSRLADEIEIIKLHIKQATLNAASAPLSPISQPTMDTDAERNAAH